MFSKLQFRNSLALFSDDEETILTAASSSGSSVTLTVKDNAGLSDADIVLAGRLQDEQSEIASINSAVTRGTSIRVDTLSFDHSVGTKIYKLLGNQIEFSRSSSKVDANSDSSSLTVLATQNIDTTEEFSTYTDTTNSTGYWYARVYNSTTGIYSKYLVNGNNYAGLPAKSMGKIISGAISECDAEFDGRRDPRITEIFLIDAFNDGQRDIAERRRWTWLNASSRIALSRTTSRYSLPSDIDSDEDGRSIKEIRLGNYGKMVLETDRGKFMDLFGDARYSFLSSDVAVTDTTLSISDTSDFDDSGTVNIQGDEITYTGNTRSTGTLTGVTGIDSAHSSGDEAWQDESEGRPFYANVHDGYLYVYPLPDSTYYNDDIHVEYEKSISDLEYDADETIIPFYRALKTYVKHKIYEKLKEYGKAEAAKKEYEAMIGDEASKDRPNSRFRIRNGETYNKPDNSVPYDDNSSDF